MRVALIWPESSCLIDPMVYPPLGLWYIGRTLLDMGHVPHYVDMSYDGYGREAVPLAAVPPAGMDFYFVSGTSTQWQAIKRCVQRYKQRLGGIWVAGGPHATTHEPSSLWDVGFDVVVKGEADRTEVIEEVLHNTPHKPTVLDAGIAPSLDAVGLPDRLVSRAYRATLFGRHATTMFTSRGCPFNCAMCTSRSLWGPKVRFVPVDTVCAEIDSILGLGFGAIQFYDDIFNVKPQRTQAIMQHLQRRGVLWRCFMRSDISTAAGFDALRDMYQAGLREVLVGVESGDQRIKDNINKGTTPEQDSLLREWCKRLGISYKASVIFGLPGETMESLHTTHKWLKDNLPDRVDIAVLIPFPGTPITERITDDPTCDCFLAEGLNGKLPEELWFKENRDGELRCAVRTTALSPEEIVAYRKVVLADLGISW